MAYIAPIHKPSSVRHAIKGCFLETGEEALAVAKANRLEIYAQTEDGLVLKQSETIYGRITLLNKLRPASASTDHLFIGTDRYTFFVLSYDSASKQLKTERSYHDLSDKGSRDNQAGDRCLIDPSGRYLTIEIFEGIIVVVPVASDGRKKSQVEVGTLLEPITTRISELFVRSSAFLYRRQDKDKPQLALLYEDSTGAVHVSLRTLTHSPGLRADEGSAEFDDAVRIKGELGLGASHIIPLSSPMYGFLVIGETSISYCDEFTPILQTTPLQEATIFVAWTQIDSQRFVLADEYGKLYLLMVVLNSRQEYHRWQLDVLGETSRANALVYLDGGRIFVGSHQGDSQVIQIQERSMEITQTFPNVAPILDFAVMDMGNRSNDSQVNEYSSGQARIVTGSGAFKDGSLRSVRSGVGLEDIGVIGEMDNITELFGIRSRPGSQYDDALVVSFLTHTRAFAFDENGEAEEVDALAGLDLKQSSLLVATTPDGLLQVTDSAARITDIESGIVVASWTPPDGTHISAASCAGSNILLSIGTNSLVLLALNQGGLSLQANREFEETLQVACITISALVPDVALIGFWKDSTIALLSTKTLETVRSEVINEDAVVVPRSILVTQLFPNESPTLFVGMADGNVATFAIDPKTLDLSAAKSIILGTQQASLKALPRADGVYNVFAICEHPSLMYGDNGRIVCSAITAEDARFVCSFDSGPYPGAIGVATDDGLKLAVVDEERTTHVQTLPVHETVRRIAYSAELRAFGLGTIKRTLVDNVENIESHFKLVDEVAFQELDTFGLNEDELIECCIRAELDDGSGALAERFVVGTSYIGDDETQKVRGRILIFEVNEERALKLVLEASVKGACRCLAMCEGRIVAALVKTIVVYTFEYISPNAPSLAKQATFRTSTAPIDLTVNGSVIAVADLMKSVSLAQYQKGQIGLPDSIKEIGRHFETAWATAVALVDDNTYLEADAEGNLIVLNQDLGGFSENDRRRLRVTSELLLGEMVNRIRRIDVQASEGAAVVPRAFLATVEGSIYLFGLIAPHAQDLLMRLQQNLAEHVKSPGDVPFNSYRAFKNSVRTSEEPNRFVDGELVEAFLEFDEATQEKIVEGLGTTAEDVRLLVENLKRLH